MRSDTETADPKRLLLVEDDLRLSRLIEEFLEENGFVVSVESGGGPVCRCLYFGPRKHPRLRGVPEK